MNIELRWFGCDGNFYGRKIVKFDSFFLVSFISSWYLLAIHSGHVRLIYLIKTLLMCLYVRYSMEIIQRFYFVANVLVYWEEFLLFSSQNINLFDLFKFICEGGDFYFLWKGIGKYVNDMGMLWWWMMNFWWQLLKCQKSLWQFHMWKPLSGYYTHKRINYWGVVKVSERKSLMVKCDARSSVSP